MADVSIRKGDRLPQLTRQFVLNDAPVDLTNATVVFNLWNAATGSQVITDGACSVTDAADGDVQYVWTSSDALLDAGSYIGSFTATYGDGRKLTAPNNSMVTVEVYGTTESNWSYTGDPSARAIDAIRFLIGDTDSTDKLLMDDEISWINLEASGESTTSRSALYDAAYRACLAVASKLARLADKQIGDLRVSLSQKSAGYLKQAQELKGLAMREGGVPIPYAGGISISDKEIDQDNSDLFAGWFASGQFQNVRDGAQRQNNTGIEYFGAGADT